MIITTDPLKKASSSLLALGHELLKQPTTPGIMELGQDLIDFSSQVPRLPKKYNTQDYNKDEVKVFVESLTTLIRICRLIAGIRQSKDDLEKSVVSAGQNIDLGPRCQGLWQELESIVKELRSTGASTRK